MANFMDLINDVTRMERIMKIVNGLWNGTVKLISSPHDNEMACEIGEYWFYFIGDEDRFLTPSEINHHYDIFTIADMILDAIIDLDDDEYTYYCDILGF